MSKTFFAVLIQTSLSKLEQKLKNRTFKAENNLVYSRIA